MKLLEPWSDGTSYIEPITPKTVMLDFMVDFSRNVILVEGPFDAMSINYNSTYTGGTVVPRSFIQRCKAHKTPKVTVVFDGDAYSAMLDVCHRLYKSGLTVCYVVLPSDKDPSDMGSDAKDFILSNEVEYTSDTRFLNSMESRL